MAASVVGRAASSFQRSAVPPSILADDLSFPNTACPASTPLACRVQRWLAVEVWLQEPLPMGQELQSGQLASR